MWGAKGVHGNVKRWKHARRPKWHTRGQVRADARSRRGGVRTEKIAEKKTKTENREQKENKKENEYCLCQ